MKARLILMSAVLAFCAGSALAQTPTTNSASGGGSGMSMAGSKSGIATTARAPRKMRRTRRR